MTTSTIAPVVQERTVDAPAATCFRVFVEGYGTWWPPEHHIGEGRTMVGFFLEPRVGGRCFDVDTDGVECQYGTVLAYEPPHRVVWAWHIQGDWTVDRDPALQSEVEVTFTPDGPRRTVVRLTHAKIERHRLPEGIAGPVAGPGGWPAILERFADRMAGRDPRSLGAG
jgi:uncharacterized protein YndB with AHSA1/START domain